MQARPQSEVLPRAFAGVWMRAWAPTPGALGEGSRERRGGMGGSLSVRTKSLPAGGG